MPAVRLPYALAARQTAQQRDRRIGEKIKRQDQRQFPAAARRLVEQQKAEQIAERHATDIAEKDAAWRPVPHEKPAGRRDDRGRQGGEAGVLPGADNREQQKADADCRRFAAGEPVDPVHEIEQIDKPEPHDRGRDAVQGRRQPALEHKARRQPGAQHEADRDELNGKPHDRRQPAQIVGPGYGREDQGADQDRCGGERQQPEPRQRPPRDHNRRDDSDAAAAGRRDHVQRARVGTVEHGAPAQQRDQRAGAEPGDQPGADDDRGDQLEGHHRRAGSRPVRFSGWGEARAAAPSG